MPFAAVHLLNIVFPQCTDRPRHFCIAGSDAGCTNTLAASNYLRSIFLGAAFLFVFSLLFFFLPSTLLDAVSNLLNLKIDFGMGHLGDGNV